MKEKKKQNIDLIGAFREASYISFSIVVLPIIFLLLGVYLDKKFSTTPLFIIFGIISGVGAFVYKAMKLEQRLRKSK